MSESIKVICRVRPLNNAESLNRSPFVVSFPGDGKTSLMLGGKTFTFDHVIHPKACQTDVYETVAKPIVVDVLNGYNGTIFAYGQTSSGKTFTMEGILGDPVHQGVIPRIVHDIFNHIYQMDENLEFHIKVSYFEIYMDKIRDLLDVSKTNLPVHEDKERVPYVKGATERFVSSPEEVFDVIDEGKANRHVAVTNMNEHSSRSHSVFMITVRQENLETQKKLHGKLYLVDLAGSEKVAKTGAEGTVLDEAKNINKSLSALGNVINALVEGNQHVPYRDSKLTRILQESLGGNARTTMVICCSPAAFNESETKSTLMFGLRAKTIKNIVTVNEELTADEWRRRYEREKQLTTKLTQIIEKQNIELAKWRRGESVGQSEWFTENQYSGVLAETRDAQPTERKEKERADRPTAGQHLDTLSPKSVEQVEMLYQQIDEKDDVISNHIQEIDFLRQQTVEQEDIISTLRKDNDAQVAECTRLQAENQSSKEEVKEVLQALEELAMNYDMKTSEIEAKIKELTDVQEQLTQQTHLVHTKEGELSKVRDTQTIQKKKYNEMMSNLLKDIVDVGECLNDQLPKPGISSNDRLDEEFTVMRLYINKMKTEAKTLQNRYRQLEDEHTQNVQSARKSDDESEKLRHNVFVLENRITTLNDKIEESEGRKQNLQEMVDKLNAEVSKLRANEQLLATSGEQNQQILDGQTAIRAKLNEEFKRQSDVYAAQVKDLREDLHVKEKKLEDLEDEFSNMKYRFERTMEELTKLRDDYDVKSSRLETMEKSAEKQEQAKQDLVSLEETVVKELQTLYNLRRIFVQGLKTRIEKSTNRMNTSIALNESNNKEIENNGVAIDPLLADEDDSAYNGSLAQREKIAFLETNLDKLTKVHKDLVRDNADLRCELPKLEKRLKCTLDRVHSLELSLKEAKEGSMRDRKRYQVEVERIKEVVRQRNMTRRGQSQIAKPIRAGHAPTSPHVLGQIGKAKALGAQ